MEQSHLDMFNAHKVSFQVLTVTPHKDNKMFLMIFFMYYPSLTKWDIIFKKLLKINLIYKEDKYYKYLRLIKGNQHFSISMDIDKLI